MNYQLEIKQIVDFPRCRIYREFLQTLMKDKSIRTNGDSYLFYFMVLCSYANFRTSYRRLDGISYVIGPGEWICRSSELAEWFRVRFQHQAITILDTLQQQNYISYTRLGHGRLIRFSIVGWKKHNTALNYNYPCQKSIGFFFFPVAAVHELISMGRCSEMDIVLDLWVHAIYNDDQVRGSDIGPVVYFRNFTGNPMVSYSDLALRWGISRSSVSRILNKLQDMGYLSLISFTGRHGSIIYLRSYLSTMFNISDVMIDKEEVSMTFQIPVQLSDTEEELLSEIQKSEKSFLQEEQIHIDQSVSDQVPRVSKSHIYRIMRKVVQILAAQGLSCCECPQTQYKLSPLSDCRKDIVKYSLHIHCPNTEAGYHFELTLKATGHEIPLNSTRKKDPYSDEEEETYYA